MECTISRSRNDGGATSNFETLEFFHVVACMMRCMNREEVLYRFNHWTNGVGVEKERGNNSSRGKVEKEKGKERGRRERR